MTSLVSAILSAALAFAPRVEEPQLPRDMQDADARAHYTSGETAWRAKDYAKAQRELEAAYAIEPLPVLLYALGQLARLQGDCERARDRLSAYLDSEPPAKAAEDARVNIERCAVAPEPAPVPPPKPAPVVDAAPIDTATPAPTRVDGLGLGLAIGGAAVAGVGLGLFGGAFAELHRAESRSDVGDFGRGVRRSHIEYWTGVALMSAGAVALVAGVVRLALVRRARLRQPSTKSTSKKR
jgi:hypothetical protein